MKGVVALALREMVVKNFGADKWKDILTNAGIMDEPVILAVSDIEDAVILKVINSTCETLGLTFTQAAEAFGEYWMTVYTPKMYRPYFSGIKNAKEFVQKLDAIHVLLTKNIPNAHPPRFDYEWKDDKTVVMTYKSERGLTDLAVCLMKGVGKHFNENLTVAKVGDNKIQVVFP